MSLSLLSFSLIILFKIYLAQERSEPCNGLLPLINYVKGGEYECFSNLDCPADSFCDRIFSKCCSKSWVSSELNLLIHSTLIYYFKKGPQLVPNNPLRCAKTSDCLGENMICISSTCITISNCLNSTFGCCDDGFTPAQGLNKENCPQACNCHPAGMYQYWP